MRYTKRLALIGLLFAPALRAHDFWIEPASFMPPPGQRVAMRLRVGQELRGDPVPRDPRLVRRFSIVGSDGEESPVLGRANTDPAGFAMLPAPGLYTVVYDSDRSLLELDAVKFEAYLEQEGLEKVSALRARRGQSAAPGREVFSRCAKALLASGSSAAPGYDRPLGQRLELIPQRNPYTLAGGGDLPVLLLYDGKPLSGALVVALAKDRSEAKVAARSDDRGRVTLRLDRPGFWLVKAVHMVAATQETGADWESFWASLTFQVPGR